MSFIVPESRRKVQPGDKFGRLVVRGAPFWMSTNSASRLQWAVCQCECGEYTIVRHPSLISGNSRSCGCLRHELQNKHGMSRSRLYRCWADMKCRCANPNSTNFIYYGARGISYCDDWDRFIPFRDWALSHGYRANRELERTDVNGHYCPQNCRWVTERQQANNRRDTKIVEAFGERKSIKEWSRDRRCAVSYNGLLHRIKMGMPAESAVIEKPKKGHKIA